SRRRRFGARVFRRAGVGRSGRGRTRGGRRRRFARQRKLEADPVVEVLMTFELPAVDEDRRCTFGLQLFAELTLLGDALRRLRRLHVRMEAADVEAELVRVSVETLLSQLILTREDHVVHLPDLALLAGGDRGAGSVRGVRKLPEHVELVGEAAVVLPRLQDLV